MYKIFQANIYSSGCAVAQKPGKRDEVTFVTTIFGISNCLKSKQTTFLELWDKTGKDEPRLG